MEKIEDILFKTADLIKKNDTVGAEKILEEALKNYKDSSAIYTNLGMLKLLKKDVDSAIQLLEKAVELDPRMLEAFQNLGSCYLYKQDIEKSENAYLKALQIDPNNFNTYHNISTLYIQTDQLNKAKKSLEKLIQLDATNPQVSFMLGMVYLSLKEYYPAVANLLYAIRQDESYDNARAGLAEAYYRLGRYVMALREYEILMEKAPTMVSPYIRASLLLIELGAHDEAIPILQRALSINRANIEVIEILAILHEEKGELEKAEELYQEILLLDPQHRSADEGIKRLESISV